MSTQPTDDHPNLRFKPPSNHDEKTAANQLVVAIVEFDRFTALRQRIGFAMANAIVGHLADRLDVALDGCQFGRVGRTSVEFAFTSVAGHAEPVLRQAIEALEQPYLIDEYHFGLSVTIGAVNFGCVAINDHALDSAAAALLRARDHHQKVRLEDARVAETEQLDEMIVMRDLPGAIAREELQLFYQPKLRARTETVDSAEALLRWHHPTLGLVRTDKLIELAEATGAIRLLTYWVVERALKDRKTLAASGNPLTLFVNLSGALLPDVAFTNWALDHLADSPGMIGFEITETAVIQDPDVAIDNLRRLVAADIKIAIDDYGSGLSSLAYLKQLPAHELKIDRMFVSGLTDSHRDPLLVRSSIDLAHALDMEVTAEGIDDPMSLSLLRIMGCDLLQGFLISPPLPLGDFVTFLSEKQHTERLSAAANALKPSLQINAL